MTVRESLERIEGEVLHRAAARSAQTKGRQRSEDPDPLRPAFQLDRDRVLHSKAFRRLAGKTQVFLRPEGDHYRTRITHTLEVSQIARSCAKALGLNEMLTEAIAMGHDLGHTPFGHAGESMLAKLMPGGYHHVKQSLRVVDVLERDGRGLNLTEEVRDGILKHSKGKGSILSENPNLLAMTLEGQCVRIADIVAYVNHDLDDAIRGRILKIEDVPKGIVQTLGASHGERISTMVRDIIESSTFEDKPRIRMSQDAYEGLIALRDFLYARVYENPEVKSEFTKAQRILGELWTYCLDHENWFRKQHWPRGLSQEERLERAVCDFLAGMTDRYALRFYEEVCLPKPWSYL